ncbi:MAG: phosphate ABC transporter permease PstC, partial [Nannocystis sp.]
MSHRAADRLLAAMLAVCGLAGAGALALVLATVLREAWPALVDTGVSGFLSTATWQPTAGRFGLLAL